MKNKQLMSSIVLLLITLGIVFCTNAATVDNHYLVEYSNSVAYAPNKGKYITLNNKVPFKNQVIGKTNTIFEIRDVFNLNGKAVKIPDGCILSFKGGALTNGTIIGSSTIIEAPNYQVFLDGLIVEGTFLNTYFNADWFSSVQDAINVAANNSGVVQLSAKEYLLNNTLQLKKGITLLGCGNEAAFQENRGTILYYRGNGPVVSLSGSSSDPIKNVTMSNLKIKGNGKDYYPGTNVGLYVGPKAYYCKFENVSLYACSNGVEIDNGWNLNFESVNSYYCKNGYYLNGKSGAPLTTTVFSSCVVYNSKVGFNFSSDMNATTIMSCGTDGCEVSMELAGCFGVSVISYEFEQHAKYGIHIDNPDCYVTFVGLSPRSPISSKATHIKIDRVGRATFTDMYISDSVVSKDGYSIDVSKSNTGKVLFNNCVLKGKGKNLTECQFAGNNVK